MSNKEIEKSREEQISSMIGKIIDMPLSDFEKELIEQKVSIGIINNLSLNLSGIYYDLKTRKDAVLNLVANGVRPKEDPEVKKCLDGLYAEMIKVEQKITFLKQRSEELVSVD